LNGSGVLIDLRKRSLLQYWQPITVMLMVNDLQDSVFGIAKVFRLIFAVRWIISTIQLMEKMQQGVVTLTMPRPIIWESWSSS
jgi:hypothetical protein